MNVSFYGEMTRFCARLWEIRWETEKGVDERIKNVDLSDGPGLVAGLLAIRLFREFSAKIEEEELLKNEISEDLKDFIPAHERYFRRELRNKIKVKLEERERKENSSKVIINP